MGHVQLRRAIGFVTPLRYPGGKRKLFSFFRDLIEYNDLVGTHYIEPFAGGAGLALSLLVSGYIEVVHLNDLDIAIYTFWKIVLEEPDELCRRIKETPIDVATWEQQREVIEHPNHYREVDVAFATLFLNRTNRSGILRGGIIGGKEQTGKWRMDARFNRDELVRRILRIASYRERIKLYNQDAVQFLQSISDSVVRSGKALIYADPPYYSKGNTLYYNNYQENDHKLLAQTMRSLSCPWIVTYDDVAPVYELYQGVNYLRYQLHYTAQNRQRSGEVMFFRGLMLPPQENSKNWHPMYVLQSYGATRA